MSYLESISLEDRASHTSTVYNKLLDRGFTAEEISAELETETSGVRAIGLGNLSNDNAGNPVLGIVYTGDFRSEEETGLASLRKIFGSSGTVQSNFSVVQPVSGTRKAFCLQAEKHIYDTSGVLIRVVSEANRRHSTPFHSHRVFGETARKVSRMQVTELKAALKAAGIKGYSTLRKDQLIDLYWEKIEGDTSPSTVSIGEFHHGEILAMMTETPILLAVLEILFEDTISVNALRVGTSENPFSRGVIFYDDRDLSVHTVKNIRASDAYHAKQLAVVEPTKSKLEAAGSLYAITPGKMGDEDKFFINYYRGTGYRVPRESIFGWFTINELEDIASGVLTPDRR